MELSGKQGSPCILQATRRPRSQLLGVACSGKIEDQSLEISKHSRHVESQDSGCETSYHTGSALLSVWHVLKGCSSVYYEGNSTLNKLSN